MNGDGSLAREELTHCLKGCILAGYGLDQEEVEDCERDIVEICMKKLDMDRGHYHLFLTHWLTIGPSTLLIVYSEAVVFLALQTVRSHFPTSKTP